MEQLNTSSSQNRNLLISFLLYVLYIVGIIASITDLDIFLDLNTKMPLLGLELSVSNFYTFAPLILVLFHINILYNTHKHLDKLQNLSNKISNQTIYPYIFNFAFLNGYLVKFFAFILLIGFSNFALWYLFISFLPLKIADIFYWHLILIFIDFMSIIFIFKKHYLSYMSAISILLSTIIIGYTPLNYNLTLQNIQNISQKNITLQNLSAIKFTRVQGSYLDFLHNNFTHSYILSSSITHSDFQFVDMIDSQIEESNMSHNNYSRVDFSHSKIKDTDFSHSTFETVTFSSVSLENVNLCNSSYNNIISDKNISLKNVKCDEYLQSLLKD